MIRSRSSAPSSGAKIDGNNGVVVLFGDSLEQHNGIGSITAGSEEYSKFMSRIC